MAAISFNNFEVYGDKDFLSLPPTILNEILSSNQLSLDEADIFKVCVRWAEHTCSNLSLKPTPSNLRLVLGKNFYEIRFPRMTVPEFTQIVCPKKLLTAEETSRIFIYLCGDEFDRCPYDVTSLGFKIHPRNTVTALPDLLSLRIFEDEEITGVTDCEPVLIGNGGVSNAYFFVDQRIELLGVGFAGPTSAPGSPFDCSFEISLEPLLNIYGQWVSCGKMERKMPATSLSNVSRFYFDQPIICDASDFSANPYNVCIRFSFNEGPGMEQTSPQCLARNQNAIYKSKSKAGITFNFRLKGKQMVELIFRAV